MATFKISTENFIRTVAHNFLHDEVDHEVCFDLTKSYKELDKKRKERAIILGFDQNNLDSEIKISTQKDFSQDTVFRKVRRRLFEDSNDDTNEIITEMNRPFNEDLWESNDDTDVIMAEMEHSFNEDLWESNDDTDVIVAEMKHSFNEDLWESNGTVKAAIAAEMDHSINSNQCRSLEENEAQQTRIIKKRLTCGASNYCELFENTVITALDEENFGKITTSDLSTMDLKNYINRLLEAAAKIETNIGLEITKFNICETDYLEDNEYGIIDEYCPDFIWNGLVRLSSGQLVKLSVEAFYFVHGTN